MRISTKTFQTVFSPSERGNHFSFSQVLTFAILLLTILNLTGCGRAGDQTLDEATKGGTTSPIGMQYISGDNQTGFAGFMFGQELVVKTYAGTVGLQSFTIRFSEVTSSGATILTPVTTTGSDGIAKTQILPSPTEPGNLRFKAEVIAGDVGQFASGFAPIFFDLEAQRGAHHLEVFQGNNQTVTVNQAAPINPTVKIVDANNDPVADWPITFTVTSGGGSITTTTKSDANGLAAVTWTMGTNSDLTNQLRANAITISNPNTLNFEADAIPDAPATILLSGGNTSVTAGDCTAVYNIQLRDQFNNISPAQGATAINLTDGASGTFHTDAACSGGNTITSVTIPDTATSGTFYYRSTLAGTFTITADDAGSITAGTQGITVNPGPADHLALSAGNGQTQVVNRYLNTQPRVKVEDQFGNGVLNYAVNFTVLTGGGSVDSPSVTSGAGGLAQVPYRLGTVAGTNTMKAENLALPGTPKTITFTETGIADSPTQMELTGPATITAGECPSAYTATLRDQFGNTALATSNTSLSLSGKADGTFYSDAGCTGGNEISSISITNGTSSRNFFYRNTKAEVVNLGINDGGVLTDDTYAVTVDPDVPYRIVLTGPDPITTGACSNQYTVTLWDQFNNVTTATTNTTINLTGKSNGEFYSDSVCNTGNEVSSIVVATGNSNNTFYYKDPIAEQLNFTADDVGALIASSLSVYSNNGAPVDNGANLQFTNDYTNTGNDIAVTWTGFTDDDLSDHRLYTYTNADCSAGETDHGLIGSTGNSNSTLIDGRTDGVYYGRVRAIDGFGNTRLSACSVDFITVDLTNPTDNGSDPQFTDAYDIDGNDVAITWTAFTDVNPLDYQIYTYTASDCSAGEVDHGRTGTSAVSNNTLIDGLSDGQYYLRIRAHDAAGNSTLGNCSTDSIIIDRTNPTDPAVNNPPSGVTVPDLEVSWTHSTDANFQTHNVKACTSNNCSTGCVGEKTSVSSPTTITLVMNNTYYICVQGQDLAGRVSNWIASATTVEARNYPPNLVAIPDQPGAAENSAITTVNAEDVSGGDTDQDGETNTYACTYDTTVNGSVSSGTACTSLTGVSFSTTTGVMDWTPNFFQSGNYEFKIVATSFQNLTDEEIFVINVANTDRPPLLRAIADQPSAAEDTAITTVDATDDNTGNDTDIDLETITYSCVYDTTIDSAVSASTLCTSIAGLSFDTSTGIMNWTPGYFQAGDYEFKITGTAFSLSDDEIFSITVANTDRPPVIAAINDQSTNENVLISVDPSDTSGGDDDIDNEAITYSCVYDTVNDGTVATGTACTSLAGTISFDTATGILDWTPNYFANQNGPDYEFKITATSGPDNLTDDEIFVITVNNVDRAPVLNAIADQSGAAEGTAITTIDATDSNSGNDNDIDNEAITYTCTYDTSIDGTVTASDLCTSVSNISFSTSTGVFDWTPGYFQAGTYEFKILATSGPDSLTDQKIFSITVANTDRPPLN